MWFLSSCAFPFAGLKRHPIHAAKSSWLLSVIKVPKYAAHRDSVVAKTRERLAQFAQLCSSEPVLSRVTQITKKKRKKKGTPSLTSISWFSCNSLFLCFQVLRYPPLFSAASHASWRWRELSLWCSQQWKIAFKKFKRNCVSITLADPWTVSSCFFFFKVELTFTPKVVPTATFGWCSLYLYERMGNFSITVPVPVRDLNVFQSTLC